MGQFLCRVADADGRVFSHVEPASSLDEARQKLVDRGLYVYSVESRGGRLADLVRRKSGRQVDGSEFLILNQQFNTLIKAGLPILKRVLNCWLRMRNSEPSTWRPLFRRTRSARRPPRDSTEYTYNPRSTSFWRASSSELAGSTCEKTRPSASATRQRN